MIDRDRAELICEHCGKHGFVNRYFHDWPVLMRDRTGRDTHWFCSNACLMLWAKEHPVPRYWEQIIWEHIEFHIRGLRFKLIMPVEILAHRIYDWYFLERYHQWFWDHILYPLGKQTMRDSDWRHCYFHRQEKR